MALERPPKYLVLNPDGVKSYRPPESKVSTWHNVSGSGKETWLTLQEKYSIPAEHIIQLNFPGAAENGKIVPEIVNWYLHYHNGFINSPETADRKDRRFKGGEKVAIPYRGSVEIGEPEIVERVKRKRWNVWIGIGEGHSGDLVALGYYNWNARVYRLGATDAGEVEWATLSSHGLKLGGGLGGSYAPLLIFAHGFESASNFRSSWSWGDMDWDLALYASLKAYIDSIKHVGKLIRLMDEYKKLSKVGEELVKNRAFLKSGVYTISIPTGPIPQGVHVWYGRKYGETMLVGYGTGLGL